MIGYMLVVSRVLRTYSIDDTVSPALIELVRTTFKLLENTQWHLRYFFGTHLIQIHLVNQLLPVLRYLQELDVEDLLAGGLLQSIIQGCLHY